MMGFPQLVVPDLPGFAGIAFLAGVAGRGVQRMGWSGRNGPDVTGNDVALARKVIIAAPCCGSTQITICFLPAWRILALKAACLCALLPMPKPR